MAEDRIAFGTSPPCSRHRFYIGNVLELVTINNRGLALVRTLHPKHVSNRRVEDRVADIEGRVADC